MNIPWEDERQTWANLGWECHTYVYDLVTFDFIANEVSMLLAANCDVQILRRNTPEHCYVIWFKRPRKAQAEASGAAKERGAGR